MDIKTYVEQRSLGVEDYANGLTHWLEIAVVFYEWCFENNCCRIIGANGSGWSLNENYSTLYTTSQLLTQYLDTLKNK